MTYQELEDTFNRALRLSFSKKKLLFVFPVLLVCGVLIVFCRAVSYNANPWVVMSLSFLPVFLCTGILLAAGVLLIRMYYHEVKGLSYRFRKLLSQSLQLLIGVSHLSLPLILTYLFLWTLMGVFHLVKVIPGVGEVFGVLLSFGPFLLVFASLVLSLFSISMLFFVTPHVALKTGVHMHIAEEILERMRVSPFANLLLLTVGLIPLLSGVFFLVLAAAMTATHYLQASAAVGVSLGWFFIMVPFTLILTPFVVFFFNFATESYGLLTRRQKQVHRQEAKVQKMAKTKEESCAVQ